MKAQSSMEYILIIALTLVIILPAAYLFYVYSIESSQEISDAQINKLGNSIIETAETIYYTGIGSKTTLEVIVPDHVTTASIIKGKELVFNVTTSIGVSEVVFFSDVNLTTIAANCNDNLCSLPYLASSGVKKLKLEAVSNKNVRIEQI